MSYCGHGASTHCIKCRSPIGGDGLLRRSEWHSAFADKLMQPRFDAVFRVWGCTGLDPQVAGIVRIPANFKWHTCASLSVSAGVNVLALRRMLGHTSAKVTLDTYSDLFDDDLDAVAVTLHARYGSRRPAQRSD